MLWLDCISDTGAGASHLCALVSVPQSEMRRAEGCREHSSELCSIPVRKSLNFQERIASLIANHGLVHAKILLKYVRALHMCMDRTACSRNETAVFIVVRNQGASTYRALMNVKYSGYAQVCTCVVL